MKYEVNEKLNSYQNYQSIFFCLSDKSVSLPITGVGSSNLNLCKSKKYGLRVHIFEFPHHKDHLHDSEDKMDL